MTVEVVPNRIELSTLTGGYMPDPKESVVTLDSTPDASNVLPASGGSLEVRNGYSRLSAGRVNSLAASHWIRHVNYYELIDSGTRKRYLMCVFTDGQNNVADNVQIWAYDLVNNTFTRVDTSGVSWANGRTEHWFAIIEGTYYGGTRGKAIYSWHPTNGYNVDPTIPSCDTWVNSASPGANEVSKWFAFKKGTTVKFGTKYYRSSKGIRYNTWETDQKYSKGEKVSRKAAEGGVTFWRSFACIKTHKAGADNDEPGTGASWETYWKRIRLDNILDDDSNITSDWYLNPVVRRSSVGAYHGNRLFVRADDDDNWARVQYSAPAFPERDAEIADLDFDPTDWAPVDDMKGEGGGWFTVPFSGKGDAIRAFQSYGNYLIIAGRWQTFVLAGTNENTWTLRKLGNYGAVSPQSIAELDGLVYLLGRHGTLAVTDGTTMQPVPGMDKIQEYIKENLDDVLTSGSTYNWYPSLTAHDGKIWISFPDTSGADFTLVYDPATQSFWHTDLPILDMTTGELNGTSRLFFSTTITGAASENPCVFQYKDDPGNETFTDDDPIAASGTASTTAISWDWRSGWFQFGMTRNERRIRRAWALVSGAASQSVIVRLFKNFVTSNETTVTRTLVGTAEAEFVESKVGQSGHTAYATGIRVSGTTSARTALHGVGIDTEPVRTRFKR